MVSHDIPSIPSSRSLDQGNLLNEEEIRRTVEFYEEEMKKRTTGPQLEAMEKEWLVEALRTDLEVLLVSIPPLVDKENGEENEKIKWPLLTPIKHHEGYDPQYFEKHFQGRNVVYLEVPPRASLDAIIGDDELAESLAEYITRNDAAVVYDFHVGDGLAESAPEFLNQLLRGKGIQLSDVIPSNIAFGVDFGAPSGTYYEGRADLTERPAHPVESIAQAVRNRTTRKNEKGEEVLIPLPENGAALLNPEHLKDEKIRERLWKVYIKQFTKLGENHPLYTNSPPEEFVELLSKPGGINPIAIGDGEIIGILNFVNRVEECVWLNPDYYNAKYGDDVWLAFVPGIVVAEEKAGQGLGYAEDMMSLAAEVVIDTGRDLVIAFGCTGVSKTYIPKSVQRFITGDENHEGVPGLRLRLDERGRGFEEVANYKCHILEMDR